MVHPPTMPRMRTTRTPLTISRHPNTTPLRQHPPISLNSTMGTTRCCPTAFDGEMFPLVVALGPPVAATNMGIIHPCRAEALLGLTRTRTPSLITRRRRSRSWGRAAIPSLTRPISCMPAVRPAITRHLLERAGPCMGTILSTFSLRRCHLNSTNHNHLPTCSNTNPLLNMYISRYCIKEGPPASPVDVTVGHRQEDTWAWGPPKP